MEQVLHDVLLAGDYEAIKKHSSDRLAILESIPDSVSPEQYLAVLPEPAVHIHWYLARARRLASAGFVPHAKSLLQVAATTDNRAQQLLDDLCEYEKIISVVRIVAEGINGALEDGLRRFTFASFEETRMKELMGMLREEDPEMLRTLYKELIAAHVNILPGDYDHDLELFPSESRLEFTTIISRPIGSLMQEIISLREQPEEQKKRIQRVLELLIMRREGGPIDLSSWIELNNYEEFASKDNVGEIESLCLNELERSM